MFATVRSTVAVFEPCVAGLVLESGMNSTTLNRRAGTSLICSSDECATCFAAAVSAIRLAFHSHASPLPSQEVQTNISIPIAPRPQGCLFHPDSPTIPGRPQGACLPQVVDRHCGVLYGLD